MDVDSMELVRSTVIDELVKEYGPRSYEVQRFTPVPQELEHAAERTLAGKDRSVVSKTSGGKLSRWAAKQRKAKRKSQRKARRRQR